MKRILLALLLIPSLAFAGPEAIENDLISNPKTGTYILGRQNEAQTSISSTAGDAIAPSFDRYGNQMCTLAQGIAAATNPVKAEDSVHVTGDSGFPAWGVTNQDLGGALCSGANNDYCPIAVNTSGAVYSHLFVTNNANSAVRSEDVVHLNGDALVNVGAVYQTTLAASAADGDYGNVKLNSLGALYNAPVPSSSADGSNTQTAYGSSYISTVSTNSTLASGNVLHWVVACNTTAANKYVKFYNSGAPTCGSGTPVLRVVAPPNNCANVNLSVYGVRMASGIGFCITGGATDADTTNTAAADVFLTIGTR